jgi:hypothetical protein
VLSVHAFAYWRNRSVTATATGGDTGGDNGTGTGTGGVTGSGSLRGSGSVNGTGPRRMSRDRVRQLTHRAIDSALGALVALAVFAYVWAPRALYQSSSNPRLGGLVFYAKVTPGLHFDTKNTLKIDKKNTCLFFFGD